MSDTKESLKFDAEISKVLKLMIHSLYTNKDIFLRELVSNAADACDRLRYQAISKPELLASDSEFKIAITADKKARTLIIADNGIGMDKAEMIANLGTIARSGTSEFFAALEEGKQKDITQIGQFGVGFYSAFMVADKVSVISRQAGSDAAHRWESNGENEFTTEPATKDSRGTEITLHLKKEAAEYTDFYRLKHIVSTYSSHIPVAIEITNEEGKSERVNEASALWTRGKNDIKPEEYKEFYHHVAHSPDKPWMTLHNKAEGKLEYTNLLFIPSIRPFDLFHPDRKRRVKLYVKRVFITDENAELVPPYMRFLRGIVDSEDLPLNISRETLQHNPILDKIREGIEKKVLAELKKKAEKEPESYAKFWSNFGPVLKEGLCEARTPKDSILEVCRFHTSLKPDGLTSLDEYIEAMPKGQEFIYYLTGENATQMLSSPQLEGFRAQGIPVLLLTDHVDDFWVNVVQKYKDKEFKSVTRAHEDLDSIGGEKKEDANDKAPENDLQELREYMAKLYGADVKEIRLSHKLTQSPVCLSVDEGAMDIRMERFMVENKQLPSRAAKIFEIYPKHPVILSLADKVKAGVDAKVDDWLMLLLDQARVQEGEEVSNPGDFSRRLTQLLEKNLAA